MKALCHVLVSSETSRSSKQLKKQRAGQKKKKDSKGKGKAVDSEDEDDSMEVDVDNEERGSGSDRESGLESDNVSWKGEAYVTSVNYHAKKMVFLLFINRASDFCILQIAHIFTDRLVESSRLKKAIDSVYSGILPKGTSPFVYLR